MDKSKLLELVDKGLSTREIAKALGKSQCFVRYWLSNHNLKTKLSQYNRGKSVDRICKCGEIDPSKFYGKSKTVCRKCHNIKTTNIAKYKRNKIIDYMGGRCVLCGWNAFTSALQIHHTNPQAKDPSFKRHRGWGWERLKDEVKDCLLLCANCHAGVHSGDIMVPATGIEPA